MEFRNRRFAPAIVIGAAAFLLVGCTSAKPTTPTQDAAAASVPAAPERQQIAEAALGRQSGAVPTADFGARTISVRWNTKTKRYQSLDQSHKGFLGELPTLESPQSILK